MSITHKKTNNIPDWTQADLDAQIALGNYPPGTLLADITLPSDWNDTHEVESLEMPEITEPPTPAADFGVFYVGDNAGTSAPFFKDDAGDVHNLLNSAGVAWGDINGDIDDQTDLQDALNEKANVLDLATVATTGSHLDLSNIGTNTHAQIDTHIADTNNPHQVTAAQAGAVALTGDETVAGVKTLSSFPILPSSSPTTDYQAAHKKYVDDTVATVGSGYKPRGSVVAATTVDITLSGEQTIDGYAVVTGNRVLVKDQSAQEDNGAYIVNSGAWTRDPTFDTTAEVLQGSQFFILNGGQIGQFWYLSSPDPIVVGTDPQVYLQSGAAPSYTASDGILLDGVNFEIDLSDTNPSLEVADGGLRAKVDNSTIERASGGLQVKDNGITSAKISGAIGVTKGGTGLTALGTANQVLGVNSGATATEYKSIVAGSNVSVVNTAGQIEISSSLTGAADFLYTTESFYTDPAVSFVWTNLPAALTIGSVYLRKKVNLTGATQFRLVANQALAGFAGSKLRIQYSTDNVTFLPIESGTSGDLDVGTGTGVKVGAWTNLVAGAKTDVWIQFYALDGDGVVDPQFRQIDVQLRYNSTIVDGDDTSVIDQEAIIHSHPASNVTWTNMPAAVTEFLGTTTGRRRVDLSGCTHYRIVVNQAIAGFAGADLNLQYSLNNSTFFAADTAGAGELDVGTGTGVKTGAWAPLVGAALGDVWLRLVGKQGNGVVDPAWSYVVIQFKSTVFAQTAGADTQVIFNDGGVASGDAAFTFDKTTETLSATYFVGDGSGLTNLPSGAVDSVNGQTGVVVLDSDDIAEGVTNLYFADERAQDAVGNAVGTSLTYNDTTGAIDAIQDIRTTASPTFSEITTNGLQASSSAGVHLQNNSGGDVLIAGAGGGVNATAYGGWNFDNATASTIAGFGISKTLVSLETTTYPTLAELSYVKGVTSAIQTQLNGKQATLTTGNLSGTTNQIIASATRQVIGGDLTLSLPQNIHTGASPEFAGMTLTGNLSMNAHSVGANSFLIGGTASRGLYAPDSSRTVVGHDSTDFLDIRNNITYWQIGSGWRYSMTATAIAPYVDSASDLGTTSLYYRASYIDDGVFSNSVTINSSNPLLLNPSVEWYPNDQTIFEYGNDSGTVWVDGTPVGLYWSNGDIGNNRFELRTQGGNYQNLTVALLAASSLSGNGAGVTSLNASNISSGTLALARGGTNASLTAANGGLVYSTASALAITSAGSAGQIPRSGGAGAPTWSTATYPSTATTSGAFMRADGTNFGLSTLVLPNAATANRVVYATGTNTWGESANLTFNGTTLTANTLNLTNVLTGTYGGTGASSFGAANRIPYASSTTALTNSANLTFTGSALALAGTMTQTNTFSASTTGTVTYTGASFTSTYTGNVNSSAVANIVGIYGNAVAGGVVAGGPTTQNVYGGRFLASHTGSASINTNNFYGVYGEATGTIGITVNNYGGYFVATGSTAGTSGAIGVYAQASGADGSVAGIMVCDNICVRMNNVAQTRYLDMYPTGFTHYAASGSTDPISFVTIPLSGSFSGIGGDFVFKPNNVETFSLAKLGQVKITTGTTLFNTALYIDQNSDGYSFSATISSALNEPRNPHLSCCLA